MRSYTFRVVLEEDSYPDGTPGFHVYVPGFESLGAATHGKTREEALRNIQEVMEMIIEELKAEGKSLPSDAVQVAEEPRVTVNVWASSTTPASGPSPPAKSSPLWERMVSNA